MNRHRYTLLCYVLLLGLTTGCSSTGYLRDRGRDAADVFTLALGVGDGAKVRIGPLQVAAIRNADLVGLRAGAFFADGNGLVLNEEFYAPVPLSPVWDRRSSRRAQVRRALATGRPIRNPYPDLEEGTKGTQDRRPLPPPAESRWRRLFGSEMFSHGFKSVSEQRGKNVEAGSPLPILAVSRDPAFYSQIEVAVGFLFSVRVGVNPGELIDFILGWTGLDLYGDDLAPGGT